ncbi:hypothetical protein NQ318_019424 [Aromia moschata]|uniref:C2H2-type domain-containing protein n=1 Tax=Aromia moschata TaxID=1265417 RepID=A0AAV8XY30_9CUCU|nr:hypothetical protein NQ318_019424 [Aromia moschata]
MYKGEVCLQAHIERHAGLKPFACNECGRKFSLRNSLNRHKMIHSGVKPYKCEVCEKRFSQSGILARHMRIHSGEKPYPCPACPKEFAYKHHLQGHVRSHHKDVDVEGTPNAADNFSEGKFEVNDDARGRTDLAGCVSTS